jgi:hypothetical protein
MDEYINHITYNNKPADLLYFTEETVFSELLKYKLHKYEINVYKTEKPYEYILKIAPIGYIFMFETLWDSSDLYLKMICSANNTSKCLTISKRKFKTVINDLFVKIEDTLGCPLPNELWEWLETYNINEIMEEEWAKAIAKEVVKEIDKNVIDSILKTADIPHYKTLHKQRY